MSASAGGHASHFSLKERGKKLSKQDSSRTAGAIHNSAPRKPGLMDCWWVWMLWRMSGGQREPAERSIVLHWPVKNSIIPPSHLWLTPILPLRQATLSGEKYHRGKLAEGPDSITGRYRNTSHSHLWLSAKSLQWWWWWWWWFCGISVNTSVRSSVWSRSRDCIDQRGASQSGRAFDSVSAQSRAWFIWSAIDKFVPLTSGETKQKRSDKSAEWIPYITLSVRHRCQRFPFRRAPRGADKSHQTRLQEAPKRQTGPQDFSLLNHPKKKHWYRVVVDWAGGALACAGQAALISAVVAKPRAAPDQTSFVPS